MLPLLQSEYELLFTHGSRRMIPIDDETWRVLTITHDLLVQRDAPRLLDVGAGIGTFTLLAAVIPSLGVWAFEPNPEILPLLRWNVTSEGLVDRVIISEKAALDIPCETWLNLPDHQGQIGLATIGTPNFKSSHRHKVQAVTLDAELLPTFALDVIKIDVEGAELPALVGASRLIECHSPALVIEVQDKRTMQFGYKSHRITDLLTGWGYQWRGIGKRDLLFWKRPEHDPAKLEKALC